MTVLFNERSSAMIHLGRDTGINISVLPFGATWASCQVPLADGSLREVLLGCRTERDYRDQTSYLGATIGRFANRLKNGQFSVDGVDYAVDRNDGKHSLHGGYSGFGRRDWTIEELGANRIRLAIVSAAGEGGFPGQMTAETIYSVSSADLSVTVEFLAAVDRPCPVSLTNHAYFNLNGDGLNRRGHRLQLSSSRFLPIDKDGIPLGEILNVGGTPFDFREGRTLQNVPVDHPQLAVNRGYNHAFILDDHCRSMRQSAAELVSDDGLLAMKLFTTLPALHVYTGNYLFGTPSRTGGSYENYAGIALEPEYLPDSPNHPEWSSANPVLYPGSVYRHSIRYQFSFAAITPIPTPGFSVKPC